MKKLQVLGLAAGLLLATSAVFASTTFNGQTGNVAQPTAEVTPYGMLVVAADYQNTKDVINTEKDSGALFIRYGIVENLEVGAGYRVFQVKGAGGAGDTADTFSISAKYLTPIKLLGFDWSVSGVYDTTHKYDGLPQDLRTTQIAWVGDQKFNVGDRTIVGTVGANWTERDSGSLVKGREHAFRYFVGASIPLVDNVTLVGDAQTASSNMDDNGLYGVAIVYRATDDLSIRGGVSNAYPTGEVTGVNKGKLFVGASMKFNGIK